MPFIASFIVSLILIVPVWKIFTKAGLQPALSLLVFIPLFGLIVTVMVLAFNEWPAFKNQTTDRS